MKILAIKGLFKNATGGKRVDIVSLSDSSLLLSNKPFFVPDFAPAFVGRASIVLRVCRLGKTVPLRFAHRYYDAVAACMIVEAQGLDGCCNPMDARCTSFDGAVMLGELMPKDTLGALERLQVSACLNGEEKCRLSAASLAMGFDALIEKVSQYFTLKMGDLIIATGDEELVLPIGQNLSMAVNGLPSLAIRLR